MAEVTGPISTLPGALHALPEGAKCDVHPDRDAVVRVQGETDSFGSEMYDFCEECFEEFKSEGPTVGRCDWCRAENVETVPRRDVDEGMYGRVYDVCKSCRDRDEEQLRRELDQYYSAWGD